MLIVQNKRSHQDITDTDMGEFRWRVDSAHPGYQNYGQRHCVAHRERKPRVTQVPTPLNRDQALAVT